MSKQNCSMMRDLLPLYADGVCSEETRKAVSEHLAVCSSCRAMLEKMNRKVALSAETDISAIKKIRKKLLAVRIAVIAAAVIILAGGLYAGYIWAVTDCSMDYVKYDLANNVYVEEDGSGDLWLCTKGNASALSIFAYPTLSDSSGGHLGHDGQSFDADKKSGMGYTLKMMRISAISPFTYGSRELRMRIGKPDPEIKYIFYYDDVNDIEYVLWGEKPQT
ncbi:MAG: zf-HC2 domain-containing protein [Oscillospiraceae bacterium]|nr:zf-HC2 domain-containing protein [Oscillospiraceae bacterium]